MYYRQAAAAILVIDVTEPQSLKVADRWIMDIRQKTEGSDCYIVMAVNKIDLTERAFTPEAIDEFCKEKGIEPKCHCLNYDACLPNWLNNATIE